jgi:hypothetical protein
MPTKEKQQIQSRGSKKSRRYRPSPFVVVILVVGAFLLLAGLFRDRPNFDAPGRSILSKAELRLAESYNDEKILVDKLHKMHSNLDKVIQLLTQAEQLDQADKQIIETIRKRLQALENPDKLAATNPDSLHQAYKEMMDTLSQLTRKLKKTPIIKKHSS